KFNAEGYDTIQFAGKTFINEGIGRRPTHQLAIFLLNRKMSYPSIAYMDENNKLITAVPGYWEPKKIEPLLEFIKKDLYKTNTPFDEYSQNFKGKVE
ncbi:thioredoxin, partial [Bacteroidota bacterium]